VTQVAINFERLSAEAEKRDQAIQQVADNSTADERTICEAALNTVIARGREFTSEDVIEAMGPDYDLLREPRLLGAVIRAYAKGNRIINTGRFITGTRRHCSPVRVWAVNPFGATQS
jgi:hypothetical protein